MIGSILLTITQLYAQPSAEIALQNMHLWRGGEVADGLVVTADVGVSDCKERFRIGLWGGTNSVGSYKEFNYYASYNWQGLSLILFDTYNFSDGANYNNREFFNYRVGESGRFLDATIRYEFGEQLPLRASWSTILFGRDRDLTNSYNLYSTYCQLEYAIWRSEKWRIEVGVGGAFALASSGDKPNFYGSEAGLVQGTLRFERAIELGAYRLPIFLLGMVNPQANQGYLQVGASFVID